MHHPHSATTEIFTHQQETSNQIPVSERNNDSPARCEAKTWKKPCRDAQHASQTRWADSADGTYF
jgi:hypothetical protein